MNHSVPPRHFRFLWMVDSLFRSSETSSCSHPSLRTRPLTAGGIELKERARHRQWLHHWPFKVWKTNVRQGRYLVRSGRATCTLIVGTLGIWCEIKRMIRAVSGRSNKRITVAPCALKWISISSIIATILAVRAQSLTWIPGYLTTLLPCLTLHTRWYEATDLARWSAHRQTRDAVKVANN